jgi:hypothetical protein
MVWLLFDVKEIDEVTAGLLTEQSKGKGKVLWDLGTRKANGVVNEAAVSRT